jgi:hypothetical protein
MSATSNRKRKLPYHRLGRMLARAVIDQAREDMGAYSPSDVGAYCDQESLSEAEADEIMARASDAINRALKRFA